MTVTFKPVIDEQKIKKEFDKRKKLAIRNYKYAVIRCRNLITGWIVTGKTWKKGANDYRWPTSGPNGKTIGAIWNLKYTGTFLRAMGEQPAMAYPKTIDGIKFDTGFIIDDQSIETSVRKFNKRKKRGDQYWKIFAKDPGGGTKRSKTHYFVGASPGTFWGFMRKFGKKGTKGRLKNKEVNDQLKQVPKNGRHVRTVGVLTKTLTEIRKNKKTFQDIVQKAVNDGIRNKAWPQERVYTYSQEIGEPRMGNVYRRGSSKSDRGCGKSTKFNAQMKRVLRGDKRAMMLEVLKAAKRLK